MNKNLLLIGFLLFIWLSTSYVSANPITKWDKYGLLLDNGQVSRYISFKDNQVTTISLRTPTSAMNYLVAETPEPEWLIKNTGFEKSRTKSGLNSLEFSLRMNGKQLSGLSGWKINSINPVKVNDSEGVVLKLEGHGLALEVSYMLYPDLPVIRKKIKITNQTAVEIKIEDLDIESLNIAWDNTHSVTYQNYARYKWIGPFIGNWDDPIVAVQDQNKQRGILLGNEAPGILKRTTVFLDGRAISQGLTHSDQDYPFRKYLEAGKEWESPWTFIIPYNDSSPSKTMESTLDDFVRKYMGIRLSELTNKPTFVYNTWNPFRTEIDEKLIMELADAASKCGIEEFVIDDGWQTNRGDWEIDYKKFPNGLKPVFDYIKSKGMKPGLWLALATVSEDSKIYKEHPEWCILNKEGQPASVHGNVTNKYTTCMTTGWKEYIRGVILNLVKEHGLEYIKLDLAIVTGAYMFDRDRSGCYSPLHSHKDREESLLEIYRNTWLLFDELHKEAPELFIDCTFETMGALQMIDYDMCKHAEGNWLSNFEETVPSGSLRVRQMGWWRSGVISATALVIGNQTLDDPNWEVSFKSLLGTLPILLGDPRKVSVHDQKKMKEWSVWMNKMQINYDYMMFRQDLPGFGEPEEGSWDAWTRINMDKKSGGIIGVFRQGGYETERTIRISGLMPNAKYRINEAPNGNEIQSLTGMELEKHGFDVVIPDEYGAKIYSLELDKN